MSNFDYNPAVSRNDDARSELANAMIEMLICAQVLLNVQAKCIID